MDKRPKVSGNVGLPATVEKEDRRRERTRHTLISVLLELIETKPYDLITVQDIIAAANVGRSTFYSHYRNKDDLLLGGFDHLLDVLVEQIVLGEDGEIFFRTSMLFDHARGHHVIYEKLIWGSGFKLLMKDGHAALSRKVEERLSALLPPEQARAIPLPLLAYTMSGGLLVLVKWWLERKMPYTPERMNDIFQQLTMDAVRAVFREPLPPADFS
jgi:AcrR family transcriptional regulator